MMDDTAASLSANIAWGTLFRNTNEDALINDIQQATSGGSWDYITPFLNDVGAFASGDATTGILDNLAQPHSAWFATGGSFTVETWSNGQTIGSGMSTITAVPEPASVGILSLGFGVMLLRRRRR
jgi:hypothetical protein